MAVGLESKALVLTGLGTGVLLLALVVGLQFAGRNEWAAQETLRGQRVETVQRMRIALATAMEAERSAVMAVRDDTSRQHAAEAHAAIDQVTEATHQLKALQAEHGDATAGPLLERFAGTLDAFRRVDEQILDLAVLNSNLKAYQLAFGPAANAVADLDRALARAAAGGGEAMRLADGARIAAWRLQGALAPHIAEESDAKMTAMEAEMQTQDAIVQKNLNDLDSLDQEALKADLQTARSSYGRFSALRTQIVKLSRENTNVRSLALSLNEGQATATACRDALIALQDAIRGEDSPPGPLPKAR